MSVQCSLYVASQAEVADFREQSWVPDDWVLELGEDRIIDLDKNWQVICAVLEAGDNGDFAAESLTGSLTGGAPIGDHDYTGFGPARLIEPSQARELSTVLADIDEAEFRQRADRADLWTTYGVAADVSPDFDYIVDQYLQLRAAYQRASTQEKSVIVWLH